MSTTFLDFILGRIKQYTHNALDKISKGLMFGLGYKNCGDLNSSVL